MTPAEFDRWCELVDSGPETALVEAHLDPGGTVVEVGCGSGRLTRRVAPQAARHVALDADRGLVAYAREHTPDGASVLAGDGTRLPVADGTADLVLDGWALSSMDVERALDERFRTVADDGTVLLITEAWDEPERADSEFVRVFRSLDVPFSIADLAPTLWEPIRDAVPPESALHERQLERAYRFETVSAAVDAFVRQVELAGRDDPDRERVRDCLLDEGRVREDGLRLREHARAFVIE